MLGRIMKSGLLAAALVSLSGWVAHADAFIEEDRFWFRNAPALIGMTPQEEEEGDPGEVTPPPPPPVIGLEEAPAFQALEGEFWWQDFSGFLQTENVDGEVEWTFGDPPAPGGMGWATGSEHGTAAWPTPAEGTHSFEVVATWQDAEGRQVYVIEVEGVSVHAVGITAGSAGSSSAHACTVTEQGGAWCWGSNSNGQLGHGSPASTSLFPVRPEGMESGVRFMDAGARHTCAVMVDGGVKCWGRNSEGQLGTGSTYSRSNSPVDVVFPAEWAGPAARLVAGQFTTCAVSSGGDVWCWGSNQFGQAGLGTAQDPVLTPSQVSLPAAVTAIASSSYHFCAAGSDGGVWCWGRNNEGQLGVGNRTDSATPLEVTGIDGAVTGLSAGFESTCALTDLGRVWCWGLNSSHGVSASSGRVTEPSLIEAVHGATAVASGRLFNCAIVSGGEVVCWGGQDGGALGNGIISSEGIHEPQTVQGVSGAVAIAADHQSACALLGDGEVKCWGSNGTGQLGDGTVENRAVPVTVDFGG